jgi:hypothetical protein
MFRSYPDYPLFSIDVFVGNILALDNIPLVQCLLPELKCVFKALVVVSFWFEALKIDREKLVWIGFVIGTFGKRAVIFFISPEFTCMIAMICRKPTP